MASSSLHTLSAKDAIELDKDLMSTGGFSLDQLMELAGVHATGGDGLVAARHLWHFGYKPTVYFPKKGKNEIFERLSTQLHNLGVPFTDDYETALKETDHVVDAIFGFSFTGAVRPPFDSVITALKSSNLTITAVDAPSSWDIETGPPSSGPGEGFMPTALVSLTAPKPLAKYFTGRHFLGGRFLPPNLEEKYGLQLREVYSGMDQIVELPSSKT
ncbi:hypothetical protein Dda_4887 [Drechslerella dactyloides]|uniref:NAD(P)H-hydrate epimerase n=1 Tax=Drechslerella dactyloides TaxID=74499 RepID=A0AAD6IXR1_DREDA|nr:hypothetical protein Dda_4887 [Drechslerella dactyloides]